MSKTRFLVIGAVVVTMFAVLVPSLQKENSRNLHSWEMMSEPEMARISKQATTQKAKGKAKCLALATEATTKDYYIVEVQNVAGHPEIVGKPVPIK
ncbi:MAG: hypothetical protein WCS97_00595 [Candidatus Paceibacterota bacterium]|jgi:hypothetical protein